ncbi:hypothetical protein [Clostridium coskatii]|nr:hypothetical protein [Clostridium coskatii]
MGGLWLIMSAYKEEVMQFMSEGYLLLFFSLFSITAIVIVALSNKNSDIKIENKITLRPDEISSNTKVNINNSKKNNR